MPTEPSTICNINIESDTTDIAIIYKGEILDTCALSIGSNCIQFSADGRLVSISQAAETFMNATRTSATCGSPVVENELEHWGNLMAELLVQYLISKRPPQLAERLEIANSLARNYQIEQLWFSGLVAELMRCPALDPLSYGDMRGYLATGLLSSLAQHRVPFAIKT